MSTIDQEPRSETPAKAEEMAYAEKPHRDEAAGYLQDEETATDSGDLEWANQAREGANQAVRVAEDAGKRAGKKFDMERARQATERLMGGVGSKSLGNETMSDETKPTTKV